MKIIKKIWNDPVWSKVIAGIIITIFGYFTGILLWIINVIIAFYHWLNNSITIPYWLFIIFIFISIYFLIKAIKPIFTKPVAQYEKEDFRNYSQDTIFGIKWRWSYSSRLGIINLNAFCPYCDFQIYPHRTSSFEIIDDIGFRCDDCGMQISNFEYNYKVLEDKVIRTIHKKLRSGEWKSKL